MKSKKKPKSKKKFEPKIKNDTNDLLIRLIDVVENFQDRLKVVEMAIKPPKRKPANDCSVWTGTPCGYCELCHD